MRTRFAYSKQFVDDRDACLLSGGGPRGYANVRLFSSGRQLTMLMVLFLIGTSSYIDKSIVSVVLEQIKTEFQLSDAKLGLLSGVAFALFYATLGIPLARWADVGDRKLLITLSLTVWSVMTFVCGLASMFWQLAVARFGVGAGEAGAIPTSQSLIADYYPPEARARALGAFMMCAAFGNGIGYALGGHVAQNYGWRDAFFVVGLIGLAFAPLAHVLLKEPRRLEPHDVRSDTKESMCVAVRRLLTKPAYRCILLAIVIQFFTSYGVLLFVIPLLMRTHGLNVGQAGSVFGGISALSAIVGNLAGGMLGDRLAARSLEWLPRLAAWAMMLGVPLLEAGLGVAGIYPAVLLLSAAMITLNGIVPPMFSALHVVCGSKRRALSVALVLLLANLLGLGLGPVVTGSLSDRLGGIYGSADGLRYALMTVVPVFLAASFLMLRAARYLSADAEP